MLKEATPRQLVPPGSLFEAQANRPVVLDDPESAWVVETGTVDLFLVTQQDGEPTGPRRHILRVGAGQAIFEFDTRQSGVVVLAIGSPGTVLRRATIEYLRRTEASGEPNA